MRKPAYEPAPNEPFLRSPPVILVLFFGMIGLHGLRKFGLSPMADNTVMLNFALFPALLEAQFLNFYRLVSYSFLHGDWSHVILNMFVLLAFGTPVALRLGGTTRFLLFYLTCVVVAGLAHYFTHSLSYYPVIGASGGVAGVIGAAVRFIFTNKRDLAGTNQRLLSLRQTLQCAPALIFVLIWLGINLLFGLLGLSPDGRLVSIAWEAHMGGFFCGLLLFGLFEKPRISASGGPGNVDYGQWAGSKKADKNKHDLN